MPHLILEHSSNISLAITEHRILEKLHHIVLGSGLFTSADVKSRAYEAERYLVGESGTAGSFAHVRVYILEGRSAEQKRSLSEPIFDVLRRHLPEETSVTADIRDLDKGCYKKVVRNA